MHVRYYTQDENGETRRERNEKFGVGHLNPTIEIPEHGRYLWEWYFDISSHFIRVSNGQCRPIPPSEYLAWGTLMDEIVHPWEYAILKAMDVAYCAEMAVELAAYHERTKPQPKG